MVEYFVLSNQNVFSPIECYDHQNSFKWQNIWLFTWQNKSKARSCGNLFPDLGSVQFLRVFPSSINLDIYFNATKQIQ